MTLESKTWAKACRKSATSSKGFTTFSRATRRYAAIADALLVKARRDPKTNYRCIPRIQETIKQRKLVKVGTLSFNLQAFLKASSTARTGVPRSRNEASHASSSRDLS